MNEFEIKREKFKDLVKQELTIFTVVSFMSRTIN